jgi:hypothetical protein
MAFDAGPRGRILAELGGMETARPLDLYAERTPPFLGLGDNNYTSDLTPEGRRSSDYFRGILNSLGASPDVDLFFTPQSNSPNAFAGSMSLTHPYQRETVIVQGDVKNAYSPDELKNILAHELNHLKYNHSGRKAEIDNQLNLNPQKMSGATYLPWTEKRWENEADLGGQRDYLNSGGDPSLFLREKGTIQPKGPPHPLFSNLSPQDTHYNDEYRNQVLKQGLMSWLTSGSNAQTLSE